MKELQKLCEETEGIKNSRKIDPSEWNKFNEKREEIEEEYRIVMKNSYKNAKNVYLGK